MSTEYNSIIKWKCITKSEYHSRFVMALCLDVLTNSGVVCSNNAPKYTDIIQSQKNHKVLSDRDKRIIVTCLYRNWLWWIRDWNDIYPFIWLIIFCNIFFLVFQIAILLTRIWPIKVESKMKKSSSPSLISRVKWCF